MRSGILAILWASSCCFQLAGATFGKVVTIGGHASDLALDERRGRLYIANFAGRRIDVMSTADNTLLSPIAMTTHGESGALALSPDNRYLVVTNYDDCGACFDLKGSGNHGSSNPTVTIIDLDANGSEKTCLVPPQPIAPATIPPVTHCAAPPPPPPPDPANPPIPNLPLTIAFGKGSQALLVTSTAFFLVNPGNGDLTLLPPPGGLPPVGLTSVGIPVPFATFPPQITQASSGISGDGLMIFVLAQGVGPGSLGNQVIVRYSVRDSSLRFFDPATVPPLGPRVVSVNQDGSNFLAAWALLNQSGVLLAEFPYPAGALNVGGHAWDFVRSTIYAQIPSTASADPPLLHFVDTDNLTVRERIRIPENLAGRSVFSSDMNTLYAISDRGVTVFPIGAFATAPRVSTQEEQLLFAFSGCDSGTLKQTLHVIDLGGGHTDFSFAVPASTRGVRFSQVSGTTPANVTIEVDPSAFRAQSGTTVIPLEILSNGSVGIANPVRLLVNTKQPDQRGIIHGLPGKIVDLVADPVRSRVYALRQDRNQVIVMDSANFNVTAILRTGNTPTKMAFTRDNRYMLVGNDHSQIANVFDLETLQPTQFIAFPKAHYPRDIAVSNSAIYAISRIAPSPQYGLPGTTCLTDDGFGSVTFKGPGVADKVDFDQRGALPPCSLGIYQNALPIDSVLTASPSGGSIFAAMPDGTVLLYNDTFQAFQASRKDLASLGGAYAALSDGVFFAGGNLFDNSMALLGSVATVTPASSVLISGNDALTVNADAANAPGLANRVSLTGTAVRPSRTVEAPLNKAILTTPPIGQIGQTIPTFLQSMAPAANGSVVYLSISGFTELPANFDQPAAVPSISAIANSADGGAASSGSLITITGSGFSAASGSASSLPLPSALAEVCATVNNLAIPLLRVSNNRIDAQLPYEVSGTANVTITGPGGRSAPFSFTAPATALAVFVNRESGDAPLIYRAADNSLVGPNNPIRPDDTLLILATGLGQTTPAAVSGDAASSDPLENSLAAPSVSLDGAPLQVTFAGLLPGLVGVYQINTVVPHDIRAGSKIPLVIAQGSAPISFLVAVANP